MPAMTDQQPDPVFLNSRREAIVIVGLWLAAFLWTVPYCYLNGFHPLDDPQELKTVFGVPDWVFWGVAAPWLVCSLIAIGLCLFFIKDDDLGEAHDGADVEHDREVLHAGDRG